MNQPMNPTEIFDNLEQSYLRYLETSFHLKDPLLRKQFKDILRDKNQPPLIRPPVLEVSPGFETGFSTKKLVDEEVLQKKFEQIDTDCTRPLYAHQEKALRKAIIDKRNLTIATGTGSGKTETFLYPIINYLLQEQEAGTLKERGVRALLLYPMNALANDQIARLRLLLKNVPEITFGRYTGETKETYKDALKDYHQYYEKEEPLPNECICRDQMRREPPHILFTNYAMLEYLLIRPGDSPVFGGNKWKFVVLDEVHTYTGALGIEIALLLRRLKERVVKSVKGALQCFATSATLGSGEKDYPAIARFASDLFGEPFEKGDVIGAQLYKFPQSPSAWGEGGVDLYSSLSNALFSNKNTDFLELVKIANEHIPEGVVKRALDALPNNIDEKKKKQIFIHSLLEGDSRIISLRNRLERDRAVELDDLKTFAGLLEMVALGNFARKPDNPVPLIPARYHIMARAISGIYGYISSKNPFKLQLLPKRANSFQPIGGNACAVFELANCNRCGEIMVVGVKEGKESGIEYLLQPPDVGDDPIARLNWFVFSIKSEKSGIDEDEVVDEGEDLKRLQPAHTRPVRLCRLCGRIDDTGTFEENDCNGHKADTVDLYEIDNKPRRSWPRQCPSCGNIHGKVASRILTGKEAPVAVISTALYQKIPPSHSKNQLYLPGGGRKLLMFSDSRQDAAFFAPFMESTYNKFKQRRYLVQALEKSTEPLDLEEWVVKSIAAAKNAGEWEEEISAGGQKREAARWVLREWIATDRRLALEGVGVAVFRIRIPEHFEGLPELSASPWNLDTEAQRTLVQIMLDSLRSQGIVSFDDFGEVQHTDSIFKPRNSACYLRGSEGIPQKRVYAWEPAEGRTNKRVDYLYRILLSRGIPEDEARQSAMEAVKNIWTAINHPNGHLSAFFEKGLTHKRESNLIRLKPAWWQVSLAKNKDLFRCDTCGTVAALTVESVCTLFQCRGKVKPYPESEREKNHYYNLFTSMSPVPLAVREHTAQLARDEAGKIQQEFIEGKVNMLSCTTTFEMGVDVGDLQAVFMRNMPPNPGNYVQRAGRAGRRSDNAAIIVSYAQRRTHDFSYFTQWKEMVLGLIRPPSVHLNNSKIIRRHVHAEALADFYRNYPEFFADRLDSLFDPDTPHFNEIISFLMNHPPGLVEKLSRIVPVRLHPQLGIETWEWLDGQNHDEKREIFTDRLRDAAADVEGDWRALSIAKKAASKSEKYKAAHFYSRQLNTLKKRSLLGKLGTYGLMPKYGFPTDVVELKVRSGDSAAGNIELQRDLKLALSEFAPGNQVVANGKIWESRGIVLPPGERKLHEFRYFHCPECRFFSAEQSVATEKSSEEIKNCHCGKPVDSRQYLFPEFGFTTATQDGKLVGEARPSMRSFSDVFFHESGEKTPFEPITNNKNISARENRHGWIHIINNNGGNHFFLCSSCGYMSVENPHFTQKKDKEHIRPWTSDMVCGSENKFMRKIALGYRYRTDVLELRFPLEELRSTSFGECHSLWLSVLHALINGGRQALNIDERDVSGCLHYSAGKQPLLVIFDTAPGGAGFVREFKQNFKDVLSSALDLLNCPSCAEDSSCIGCLRNYYNQRDHNQLKRMLALNYLNNLEEKTYQTT